MTYNARKHAVDEGDENTNYDRNLVVVGGNVDEHVDDSTARAPSRIRRAKPSVPKSKPPKKRRRKAEEYSYTKLSNLSLGTHNLYGVVCSFSQPKRTRGSDMMITVSLVIFFSCSCSFSFSFSFRFSS